MHRSKAFFRKTRKGKVLRVVGDHYLRDDIGCGTVGGKTAYRADLVQLGGDSVMKRFLVPDTNVVLNQMDLLEHKSPALSCVIILQTVVEETRHNNLSLYRRLKQLLEDNSRAFVFFANEHHCETFPEERPSESPNDRNDRAIREATAWFAGQLGDALGVTLLTNDRANLASSAQTVFALARMMSQALARSAKLQAMTIHEYVTSLQEQHPDMLERLAPETSAGQDGGGGNGSAGGSGGGGTKSDKGSGSGRQGGGRGSLQRQLLFPEHKPMSELMAGIREGRYFQGTLRTERNSWNECYVLTHGTEDDERIAVYMKGATNVNRAVDGDVVAFQLLPKNQWLRRGGTDGATSSRESKVRDKEATVAPAKDLDKEVEGQPEEALTSLVPDPTSEQTVEEAEGIRAEVDDARPCGQVVGIIRRHWQEKHYCGSLLPDGDRVAGQATRQTTSALFVPVDKKIPRVRIMTRQREALSNKRILVAMDSWPAWCRYPLGHYVKTLGQQGDKATETEVILIEHDIPHESFSGKVLECLPPNDWAITEENSRGRRDLRHIPVLSIDPPGCKDIDDALHARPLDNGNLEVGVHIADVTHFVAAGCAMDEEAASRSTSTYLVGKRLDMLPGLLTETLCSLKAGVDRFAFSVIWEMTQEGEVVSVDFCKSIIHSVAALSYDEAQAMLDDPNLEDVKARGVRILNRLAKIFRKRRMDAGALTLASPEVRFTLDSESQNPTDVQMYALKETNSLVEEFMLLANITVGKKILRHFPTLSVLRRHPAPSRQQYDPLIGVAKAVGVKVDADDSKRLADSLDLAQREGDAYFNKLLRILATRCMMPAQYFCSGEKAQEEWHHFGLAAPIYTHFTSPIRRYADVCVHRLLAASLGVCPLPLHLMDKANVHDLTENMNRRHKAAQLAGRASVALHTVLYFKQNPSEEKAYVLTVTRDKITVLVPRYGIEGTIDLEGEGLVLDEEKHKLTAPAGGSRGSVSVQALDAVHVYISVSDSGGAPTVSIALMEPRLGGGTRPPSAEEAQSTTSASTSGAGGNVNIDGDAAAAAAGGPGSRGGKRKPATSQTGAGAKKRSKGKSGSMT